jgi:serine/threonine protein kinase
MVRTFLDLDSSRQNTTDSDSDEAYSSGQSDRHGSTSSGESSRVNLGSSERLTTKPSDFEFLKVIGKGSFGKVLLARHKTEDELYAVKVLNKSHVLRKNETKHIMAERNVLIRNVIHPFLVGLHYSFQTGDKLYFVLDYINGGELFFHIQRERCFSEARSRFYAAEIASALGYLHSLNIIYRDLKPENILLDNEGHVALTDFGLCKEGIAGRNTTSTFCGTPEYLAPEVLQKKPYDRAVDWWCLGSVLYEILFGLPPFYSRNTSEMYENTLHKPLQFRSTNHVSPAAVDILEKLLTKDKAERLGTKRDVEEIKEHEFFASINWTLLDQRLVEPPFVPDVAGKLDFKNFDQEFVREQVPASVEKCTSRSQMRRGSSAGAHDLFQGFSYVKPKREVFQF